MKRKSEAGLHAMDIPGRLVKVGESIKFRIPPDKGGERRKGVMSAIIDGSLRYVSSSFAEENHQIWLQVNFEITVVISEDQRIQDSFFSLDVI